MHSMFIIDVDNDPTELTFAALVMVSVVGPAVSGRPACSGRPVVL